MKAARRDAARRGHAFVRSGLSIDCMSGLPPREGNVEKIERHRDPGSRKGKVQVRR